MNYPMYSIRDVKVGFGIPFPALNDEVAKRDFGFKINSPGALMEYIPGDFDLYRIGRYDTDSGKFDSEIPEYIVNGRAVYGEPEK